MNIPSVTILVPNFRTPELTRICLRLLRKHTRPGLATVIAIDNGSNDASLDYLRELQWIQLIERRPVDGESVGMAHARALDLGLECVETPFVLSIHTDTLVYHPRWLEFLLERIEGAQPSAAVGSWKLEQKPLYRRALKQAETFVQSRIFPAIGKGSGQIEGEGDNFYYLRSHCALYRMSLIRQYGLSFAQGEDTAGRQMYRSLVEKGHNTVFLPAEILGRYLLHVNHATMVLNPQLGSSTRSVKTGSRRIRAALSRVDAEAILRDSALDQ